MGLTIALRPPQFYVEGSEILSCQQALVCSFLQGHGLPWQWAFSDSWGFCYRSVADFAVTRGERLPYYDCLQTIFHTEQIQYQGTPLTAHVEGAISRNRPLFVAVDAFHLPYHPSYRKRSEPHYVMVTESRAESGELHTVDWQWQHAGWISAETVETAYVAMGGRCFERTDPSLRLTRSLLSHQVTRVVQAIDGAFEAGTATGLEGLMLLLNELPRVDAEEAAALSDRWFFVIKKTEHARRGFREFLACLHATAGDFGLPQPPEAVLDAVVENVDAWRRLQAGIWQQHVARRYRLARCADSIQMIIETERRCSHQLQAFLSQSLKE